MTIPAQPEPVVMVIFGAGGDLAWRKLVPALYNLFLDRRLPGRFAIVGMARKERSDDDFRRRLREGVDLFSRRGRVDEQTWGEFASRLSYAEGDFTAPGSGALLGRRLDEFDRQWDTRAERVFYLAIPPNLVEAAARQLEQMGVCKDCARDRLVVEKPFGRDLESARALDRILTSMFAESQIYRIDHYLGKETVQNILALRFANSLFEPVWNRRYIDHVQITVAETVGVEQRGGYYEHAGALRDMVQNHLFQLLAFTAMEPPISFAADAVRDERVKVLNAIRPLTPTEIECDVVRGQYTASPDRSRRAYRDEPQVAPDSRTETFVALKLHVENWRWADVPFYVRTGKRLAERTTEIVVEFKRPPFLLFRETPVEELQPNQLLLRIQPDEGIALRFEAKVPGPRVRLATIKMDCDYSAYFGATPATGYETLLYDAMIGDSTLFHRADSVEAGWTAVDPILAAWAAGQDDLCFYPSGEWGPRQAEQLMERDGRMWRRPDR